jgi:SagB-type dehydrogenase family enzyme
VPTTRSSNSSPDPRALETCSAAHAALTRRSRKAETANRIRTARRTLLVRNPDLLIYWQADRLLVKELESGNTAVASAEVIGLLDLFDHPRHAREAAARYPDYEPRSVERGVARLTELGLLVPAEKARRKLSRITVWKENVASAHYHVASRDIRYLRSPRAIERDWLTLVAAGRRPRRFKRYRGGWRKNLSRTADSPAPGKLEEVLEARRTVRRFSREPVTFEELSRIVNGTWGRKGWLNAGVVGRMPTKTSPSAGALHPIECYVLAWNVRNLPAGLYHYDVGSNELRRLRRGDFRREAIHCASGQRFVGRAAFLCVMTAMFERTLWKYEVESAYRVVWLDAGHLAQTFCLLSTALGLGPFTTAAIQDSVLERLIGIDGVREFPLYLCGAGVPTAISPASRSGFG